MCRTALSPCWVMNTSWTQRRLVRHIEYYLDKQGNTTKRVADVGTSQKNKTAQNPKLAFMQSFLLVDYFTSFYLASHINTVQCYFCCNSGRSKPSKSVKFVFVPKYRQSNNVTGLSLCPPSTTSLFISVVGWCLCCSTSDWLTSANVLVYCLLNQSCDCIMLCVFFNSLVLGMSVRKTLVLHMTIVW